MRTARLWRPPAQAGLRFAVSPVLDPVAAQAAAYQLGITLVPGVFTPTEVQQAVAPGLPGREAVPGQPWALATGAARGAPGRPCRSASPPAGCEVSDLSGWLQAGVDAVALGCHAVEPSSGAGDVPPAWIRALATWVQRHSAQRPHQRLH